MNPTNTSLPRDLRNAVRSAITAHGNWEGWRAVYLPGRSAADMKRHELIDAANAMQIDIAAIAAVLPGGTPNVPVTFAATQQDTSTMETAPAALTARDDADALAAPQGGTLHAAFEGRDPEALVNEALAGVEGMIGSKIVAMLKSSIAPLAKAA
jgi:hypothetical protein